MALKSSTYCPLGCYYKPDSFLILLPQVEVPIEILLKIRKVRRFSFSVFEENEGIRFF